MNNFIAFNLEGPLSPNDLAGDLMTLFPSGDRVFEAIRRYDDLLTLETREGYEPGDMFAFIVPFLVLHDITEDRIINLAAEAKLTGGAAKLVDWLDFGGWKVFCITATYEQYAIHLTHNLGIYAHNVACTPFPLNEFRYQRWVKEEMDIVRQVEKEILALKPVTGDARIKQLLDRFFREQLSNTALGTFMHEVKPAGGRRKVAALNNFAEKYQQPLSRWVVVGDGIADFRMLRAVEDAGGLAIAFNANGFALPHATMSLASTQVSDLTEVLTAWQKGSRGAAEKLVRANEKPGGSEDRKYFHWLSGRHDIADVVEIHKRIRRLVRNEAGNLPA